LSISKSFGGVIFLDKLFTIGETAKIMGVSIQSLRHYSNMGLLHPEYVDPDTGYRYYSFNQLHYIDRIKYLRRLGVPLLDIKDAFDSGSPDRLVPHLKEQKIMLEKELKSVLKAIEDVEWYTEYFEYPKKRILHSIPYIKEFPKRYAFGTVCGENEKVSDIEIRLTYMRNSSEAKAMTYFRQYGYTADFNALKNGRFEPFVHYMFLKEKPYYIAEKFKNDVLVFPKGEYLCFLCRLRSPNCDFSQAVKILSNVSSSKLMLANEYEDNLREYSECPYEIQVLISEDN
jgi:DNA-binding transcriptional MerR regulator